MHLSVCAILSQPPTCMSIYIYIYTYTKYNRICTTIAILDLYKIWINPCPCGLGPNPPDKERFAGLSWCWEQERQKRRRRPGSISRWRKEALFYLSCSLKEIVGSKAEPSFVGKRSFLKKSSVRGRKFFFVSFHISECPALVSSWVTFCSFCA